MASFNLGRIKGDKGDKGDTGAKGEQGLKGERGERGERGTDGRTPVFTIGETATLPSSEEAYAVLNTDNPENPVLSFYIPRGKDGKDAAGDMLAAVYDSEGIGQDFYKYARELSDKCLKVSGGTLGGALKAAESSVLEGAVRNICALSALPDSGADGDICIITRDENAKKLGECNTGSIMLIEENGKDVPYIIAACDYHADNTVTLVRKELYPHAACFDNSRRGNYLLSDMDILLETIYKSVLSDEIQRSLVCVNLGSNIYRHCFLLTHSDLSQIEYFQTTDNRIAYIDGLSTTDEYLTRGLTGSKMVYIVTTSGVFGTIAQNVEKRFRPTIVLPGDLKVENTEYNSTPAAKLSDAKRGIYMRLGGEWKECVGI